MTSIFGSPQLAPKGSEFTSPSSSPNLNPSTEQQGVLDLGNLFGSPSKPFVNKRLQPQPSPGRSTK